MTKTENYWLFESKSFNANQDLEDLTDAVVSLLEGTSAAEIEKITSAFSNVVFFGNVDLGNDDITVVPSKNEAEDYLYMLKIEQDLGDFE